MTRAEQITKWMEQEFHYNGLTHYVDNRTKKILGGIERTYYDGCWKAWLTKDGAPDVQLGEYTEKDAAMHAVYLATLARQRKGRKPKER